MRQRPDECNAVEAGGCLPHSRSSGPSPMNTALMSCRPRARSAIASTRWMAPCHARKAPTNTTMVSPAARKRYRAGCAGRNASVSAPHSVCSTPTAGTWPEGFSRSASRSGRPAALPVAPPAQGLDDQRAVDEPFRRAGMIDDRRVHLEHPSAPTSSRRECLRRRSCNSAR